MKTQTFAILALATSASATWLDAKKFTCPSNTDNKCIDSQKSGFSWEGLNLGSFSGFGGLDFSGFQCADSFDGKTKRDHITGRTFQNKCIKGKATPEKSTAPSFGCGSSKEVEKFSVKEFQVSVEFDCTLEFHYDMPDGSTCKQKSDCKKSGTTVKNTQCGGAKNVKVILPSGGKKSCDVGFHHIDFDCAPPATTKPVTTPIVTPTPSKPTESTTPALPETTPAVSSPEASTTDSASPETTASVTPPFPANSTTPAGTDSVPLTTAPSTTRLTTSTIFETSVSTIISCAPEVTDCPAGSTVLTTVTIPVSTTICPVTESVAPTPTPEVPGTTPQVPGTTPEVPATTPEVPATTPAGPDTTPSATPDVPASPSETPVGQSSSADATTTNSPSATPTPETPTTPEAPVDVTTVIIETSTTLCPVTTTKTQDGTTTVETGVSTSTVLVTSTSTVCTKCTVIPTTAASTAEGITSPPAGSPSAGPSTTKSADTPVTTAPCPDVVPQCLNTWLFDSGCKSNTDADCFCPSADFVKNVFDCFSAHGASDSEVAKAQSYFQGICAAHIPTNPAIVTCVTPVAGGATPVPTAVNVPVTTVQVLTTIVEPCTQTEGPSSGSVIPESSTTIILSTALTVPQVVFQTVTGSSTAAVSLVQGTAPASTAVATTKPVATGVPTTLASIPVASATNGTASPSSPVEFTGAGSKAGVTFGSIFAAGLIAVLAL